MCVFLSVTRVCCHCLNEWLRIVYKMFMVNSCCFYNVACSQLFVGFCVAIMTAMQHPNGAQQQKTRMYQFKLVLLGESAVGKSSLVLRFVKGQFHEYQESTIGGICQLTCFLPAKEHLVQDAFIIIIWFLLINVCFFLFFHNKWMNKCTDRRIGSSDWGFVQCI